MRRNAVELLVQTSEQITEDESILTYALKFRSTNRENNNGKYKLIGLFDGEKPVLVRKIYDNGNMVEQASGKFDLFIVYDNNSSVSVQLVKKSNILSRFFFDSNFIERKDGPFRRQETQLNLLSPDHFNPNCNDPKVCKVIDDGRVPDPVL